VRRVGSSQRVIRRSQHKSKRAEFISKRAEAKDNLLEKTQS
jgi:hypothetical protein